MRIVGLDIHRVSAEAVMLDEGKIIRLGRVAMTRDHLEAFARRLTHVNGNLNLTHLCAEPATWN